MDLGASSKAILRNGKKLRRQLRELPNLREFRIAVLGGSTTDEFVDFLEIELLSNGIRPTFYQSEYGAYFEEAVLSPSTLAAFRPQLVVVYTTVRNIRLDDDYGASEERFQQRLEAEYQRYVAIWDSIEQTIGCEIIQNTFDPPLYRILGNLDASHPAGAVRFVNALNCRFAEAAASRSRLRLNDLSSLASQLGVEQWRDLPRWFSYKLAHTPAAHLEIARSVGASITSALFGSKKCLVLDLDNTLWGGVIGDDGVDKIRLGRESADAEAFVEFHEYCLRLRSRGILLAVCSKNNHDIAMEGLRHPDSVLRPEHFAAIRANWLPKDENIRSIAEELNIGVDSLVFVDDNPAERALVAAQLPTVGVPEVGSDVSQFAAVVESYRFFETTAVSGEDLVRSSQYQANTERVLAGAAYQNYGEYLSSLEMSADIGGFKAPYLERIAQLVNKTNQFNLTTRRLSHSEVLEIAADSTQVAIYGRLADKFGDNGLVTVVQARVLDGVAHVELWLMSCRVLKRELEAAMLDVLVERCAVAGASAIHGLYIPTAKNAMVADHYSRLGFRKVEEERTDGATNWYLEVAGYTPRNKHIQIERSA
ncbi:HAD-IIIC family phosphatase [Gemmatimonas groenlandica]|uniref:HAD-IIIC family phosphatase n=1 Tax=Gemmatimonas groenlandica TaxID=2732249 RepID=A0A6M4ITP5_9BACT|nr:HAD-IIIC family phosphatase [Gemmatimonas groenlandica]QJR36202.1 HAD-IIIC family phosphatase [Gemmatimonas groenlandica]